MKPSFDELTIFEKVFWSQDLTVAGTDEVGRGPLAGPVVAAAVILSPGIALAGLDDSKKLSHAQRVRLADTIYGQALAIGIGAVGPRTIEAINILEASRLAMRRAIDRLAINPDVVLSDAMKLPDAPYHTAALIRGDQRSASIAAASIIAKVVRDAYMDDLERQFPGYGFSQHKGYATRFHRQALLRLGPCAAHRASFLHLEQGA